MSEASNLQEPESNVRALNINEVEEDEGNREIFLSVFVQQGQIGLSYYDSCDYTLHFMPDTMDNSDLQLLDRVIQELSPNVLITSAKQEQSLLELIEKLELNPEYKPEIVMFPNANFGLEISRQRLLSAHIPSLPPTITESEKIPYLSSCIPLDSVLMMRSIGGLLKCLERRRVSLDMEDMGVPIMQFLAYTLKDVVYIDKDTYSALQIFKSELHPSVFKLQLGEKEGLSLYGVLNCCRSKFGSLLLRQWFHRPTRDLNILKKRQEVIRFFTSPRNFADLNTLQSSLRNIKNISTLLHKMSLANPKVVVWQSLYKTVYNALCIRDTIRSMPQSIQLFSEISQNFTDDLFYIATYISKVVDFEGSVAENRFTVRPNVDPVIDEKKRRMMGLPDFLTDVARAELEKLDPRFSTCSIIYIPLIGFLLSVPRLPTMLDKQSFEIEGLDFMFLSKDQLHYRSARTKELDSMLGDLHCDTLDLEMVVMRKLQASVLQRSHCLYKVMSLCAELDCLIALAQASLDHGYCCPTLTSNHRLALMESRHPLLELCTPVFVSNTYISSETEGKVKVITGPNSSGKSIYLKQVGLIVFMALIGSDVPAKEAEIGLVDAIFSRMHSRESVSVGLSTFMLDLNQMTGSLNHSTGDSLVLVDEFGKGTNTVDGLALLTASLNNWMRRGLQCPHLLMSTCFHSLIQLGLISDSPLLDLLTLETAIEGEELVFLYQVKNGICQSSCAANIATLAGISDDLVKRGVEVSELYRTGRAIRKMNSPSLDEQYSRCVEVVEKFLSIDLDDPELDPDSYLKDEVLPTLEEELSDRCHG
ncbi:mutS protein homolog 5 isoform X1 [Carassius carassius]|uniref:mutS protein homolog 5 isoform X1 n=1 Tax=Carassius carassius TaxID=217509 RepID=UPI002868B686|nr:mutS protein homolog 5 isoform X1 [Carassius carassius]XP_059369910.1 mutS protein homolog 5 isoform X1 [Carassius carassius]